MKVDKLLPVLRNLGTDVLSQIGVHRTVAPGLAVFLAEVAPTPAGTLHVEYVLRTQSPEKVGTDDQLFEAAFKHLITGLRVDAFNLGKGHCFRVHRPEACGAAVIALPNFFESAVTWCESEELFVFVEDVNCVWVGKQNSEVGRDFLEKARRWRPAASAIDLDPVCLSLRKTGFERLS